MQMDMMAEGSIPSLHKLTLWDGSGEEDLLKIN